MTPTRILMSHQPCFYPQLTKRGPTGAAEELIGCETKLHNSGFYSLIFSYNPISFESKTPHLY